MSKVFSTSQVAKILGVSRQTVITWCNSGKLTFLRTPSGQIRIPEKELRRVTKLNFAPNSEEIIDAELDISLFDLTEGE